MSVALVALSGPEFRPSLDTVARRVVNARRCGRECDAWARVVRGKHVTAHTLRHTAATWLRQATGDTRLVAECLGYADLSTVSRYSHVASEEMHAEVQVLADCTYVNEESAAPAVR